MKTIDMVITTSNLDMAGLAVDVRREIKAALSEGRESEILVRVVVGENGGEEHYAFFPRSRRGAVSVGAPADWTDCDDIDDLVRRWAEQDLVH